MSTKFKVQVTGPGMIATYAVTAANRTAAKQAAVRAFAATHQQRGDAVDLVRRCTATITDPAPKRKVLPDHAGIRSYTKSRRTGTHIGVYDGIPAGMDTEAGRWQTICEEHGHVVSSLTLDLAIALASVPDEWCEFCQGHFDAEGRSLPVDQWPTLTR